jgi:hypothetical protein
VGPVAPPPPVFQVIRCSLLSQSAGGRLFHQEIEGVVEMIRTLPRSTSTAPLTCTHAVTEVTVMGAAVAAPDAKNAAAPKGTTAASSFLAIFIASGSPESKTRT